MLRTSEYTSDTQAVRILRTGWYSWKRRQMIIADKIAFVIFELFVVESDPLSEML